MYKLGKDKNSYNFYYHGSVSKYQSYQKILIMTENSSNSSEIEISSLIPNNTTIINKDTVDIAGTHMEPIAEENPTNDTKLTSHVQNESKQVDFEVSYNDAEKMNVYNIFDRRIEHGSEIIFSYNHYTTLVTFEFAPEKNPTYIRFSQP